MDELQSSLDISCSGPRRRKLGSQCILEMTWTHSRMCSIWMFQPRSSRNVVETTQKEVVHLCRLPIYASSNRPKRPSCAVSAVTTAFCSRLHQRCWCKVSTLLQDFRLHNPKNNLFRAESRLDEALFAGQEQLETVLVMDADRTLVAEDTGKLFWKKVSSSQ